MQTLEGELTEYDRRRDDRLLVFHAHSTARPDKSDWQLLHEHLLAVGALASPFAASFGVAQLAEVQ